MLRIGICDDESHSREGLKLLLERILRNQEGKIFYEFSSGEGLVGWAAKHPGEMDLLFLDVEMKGITGIEAARKLRELDEAVLLVFVTGYADFVFDGYSVQAMDYMMKPAKEEKLKQVVSRALEQMETHRPQLFILQNSEGLYRIPKREILYFYSDRRLVKLVTKVKEYAYYGKLDEVQEQLGPGFVRIHQRYLVRAGAVEVVEGGTVSVAGEQLPISRSLRQQAVMELARAMLGDGLA